MPVVSILVGLSLLWRQYHLTQSSLCCVKELWLHSHILMLHTILQSFICHIFYGFPILLLCFYSFLLSLVNNCRDFLHSFHTFPFLSTNMCLLPHLCGSQNNVNEYSANVSIKVWSLAPKFIELPKC